MRTSLLALFWIAAAPSLAEPTRADEAADVSTLLAEITATPVKSPARAALCADARTSTRDVELAEDALAQLRAECPSWFPVPAAPDFCRSQRCAADFSWK